MSDPFADPSEADFMPYNDLIGSLLLFTVLSFEEHIPTQFTEPGEKSPAVRANVHVIDGKLAGTKLREVLIFPARLRAQLRPRIGQMVLGRLGHGTAKPGRNAPWELTAANADDKAKAQQMLNQPTDPAPTGQQQQPGSSWQPQGTSGQPPF